MCVWAKRIHNDTCGTLNFLSLSASRSPPHPLLPVPVSLPLSLCVCVLFSLSYLTYFFVCFSRQSYVHGRTYTTAHIL